MLILALRTDRPDAELALYDGLNKLSLKTWHAHRILAETIHSEIKDILNLNNKSLSDLEGIIVYQGPGSFTGLRIGISVANALAVSLKVPIVGVTGDGWLESALKLTVAGEDQKIIIPKYGAPVHITQQKK